MAKKAKKRGGSDRGLIALSQPYEVRYWSKKFKVTPARLRQVVRKVGHSAKKVGAISPCKNIAPRDRALISLSEAYEVRYWAKKFKVTPARLKAAVKAAGRSSRRLAPISPPVRRSGASPRHSSRPAVPAARVLDGFAIQRVALAEAADPAHRGLALGEGGEAAIAAAVAPGCRIGRTTDIR